METLKLKENLKFLFYKKETYASELARVANVPKQNICDWQSGAMPGDPIKLKRVANALGVTMDELLFADLGRG